MSAAEAVLLVGNFLSSRVGNHCVCEDLALRLREAGRSVLTTSHRPERIARLVDMLSTIYRHRRKYTVAHVDVYSGAGFCLAEATCLALHLLRKPYVLTLRGGNLPAFSRSHLQRVRRLLRSAAAVTTPSAYLFEQMKPYRHDLQLLPNPLDIRQYPFSLRTSPRPKLVWLRSFHETYNPSLVPRAMKLLVSEFPDIQAVMVGRDKGDGSLQKTMQLADELELDGRIQFTGGVPKADVPQWLGQGDIFLNTTNVDNTPISVLEAMACGLCVVSTRAGGMPYLVRHDHDGLLVSPNDPGALSTAIRRVLAEPQLAGRLSANARKSAESFDWSLILPQWEALLMEVKRR